MNMPFFRLISFSLLASCMTVCAAFSQQRESPVETPASGISHGTLVVAIGTPRFIVVAADSRRSWRDGSHQDDSKKLFRVGEKRAIAIAGLASAPVAEVPGLVEEIAPLLEEQLVLYASGNFAVRDDREWNDPPRPDVPGALRDVPAHMDHIDDIPYDWWRLLGGPTQTIANIAATFHPGRDLSQYTLEGLLAGFKESGEAKLEHLVMVPRWVSSNFGRPYVALSEMRKRRTTKERLIYKTMGITKLADSILEGQIDDDLHRLVADYPFIKKYLDQRTDGSVDAIGEKDAIGLCGELITLTASQDSRVGSRPLQIAVLHPRQDALFDVPSFSLRSKFLEPWGTWNLGVVFTPDFPFEEQQPGSVYVWSSIKDNKSPVHLDKNYFYGNQIENATFIYSGGPVWFGSNNRVTNATLKIAPRIDESPLQPILHYFTRILRGK